MYLNTIVFCSRPFRKGRSKSSIVNQKAENCKYCVKIDCKSTSDQHPAQRLVRCWSPRKELKLYILIKLFLNCRWKNGVGHVCRFSNVFLYRIAECAGLKVRGRLKGVKNRTHQWPTLTSTWTMKGEGSSCSTIFGIGSLVTNISVHLREKRIFSSLVWSIIQRQRPFAIASNSGLSSTDMTRWQNVSDKVPSKLSFIKQDPPNFKFGRVVLMNDGIGWSPYIYHAKRLIENRMHVITIFNACIHAYNTCATFDTALWYLRRSV